MNLTSVSAPCFAVVETRSFSFFDSQSLICFVLYRVRFAQKLKRKPKKDRTVYLDFLVKCNPSTSTKNTNTFQISALA